MALDVPNMNRGIDRIHAYSDHIVLEKKNPAAITWCVNRRGDAIVIADTYKKGKVVFCGIILGIGSTFPGSTDTKEVTLKPGEQHLLEFMLQWLRKSSGAIKNGDFSQAEGATIKGWTVSKNAQKSTAVFTKVTRQMMKNEPSKFQAVFSRNAKWWARWSAIYLNSSPVKLKPATDYVVAVTARAAGLGKNNALSILVKGKNFPVKYISGKDGLDSKWKTFKYKFNSGTMKSTIVRIGAKFSNGQGDAGRIFVKNVDLLAQ
jgi:hypothetical protein